MGQAYAFALDVQLKPNEFRLLAWMSLRALDSDSPPRYFASREETALALGRRVPDAGADDAGDAERQAAFQAIKEATAGLIRTGAIKRTRIGGNGRRAEYALVYGRT